VAFREFRYHPDAEAGLRALFALGDTVFEALEQQIRTIQNEWQPDDKDVAQFIVPFHGFFLIFTVLQADRSVLVLAAVEPQPRE
jgi:hypothetical protein